jgi:pyruvate ferredoxin oxidoreductase gamma subunit
VLIVQDPTLLHQVDVFQGLKPDGYVLINSAPQLRRTGPGRHRRPLSPRAPDHVPASEIARKHLSAARCPMPCCWAASRRWPA